MVKLYDWNPKGAVFARIQMDFREPELHMPVAGHIIRIHNMERLSAENLLLNDPESEGWLIKIEIRQRPDEKDLILEENYHMHYPPLSSAFPTFYDAHLPA